MTQLADLYPFAINQAFLGKVNWTSDTIKGALVTSAYTPNLSTDEYWSTPQADESVGTGYVAGGAILTGLTATTTVANSWSPTWAGTTAYQVGQVIKPSGGNGYLYKCVSAGTSGGSAPAFPTVVGETVTDSGAIWANCGTSITVYTSASVSWSATGGALAGAFLVIYDATPGTAGTDPLIAVQQFGSTVTATNAAFTVAPDATHGWFYTTSS